MGAAVVLASVGLLLAGCAPLPHNGPLVVDDFLDETCMPASLYETTAFGTALTNTSRSAIEVTSVELVNGSGLELRSNSLLRSSLDPLLADAFPPVAQYPEDWPKAKSIDDSIIEPREVRVSLVSEIRLDGDAKDGHLDGLTITYRNEAGKHWQLTTTHTLDIRRGTCKNG